MVFKIGQVISKATISSTLAAAILVGTPAYAERTGPTKFTIEVLTSTSATDPTQHMSEEQATKLAVNEALKLSCDLSSRNSIKKLKVEEFVNVDNQHGFRFQILISCS